MAGDALDRAPRRIHEPDGVAAVGRALRRHGLVRLGRGEPQVFEVARRSARSPSSTSSPRCGATASISSIACRRSLGLAGAAVALGDEHVQLALLRLPAPEHLLVVAQQHARTAARRSGRAPRAARSPTQPDLLRLPVHDDELLADLVEHADRAPRGRRRWRGCGPRRDRAAEDEAARPSAGEPSRSPPASRTRSATGAGSATSQCPSTTACAAPARIAPLSARSPSSRPSAVTTIVLPAPVSPVSAVKPGPSGSRASPMTPRSRIEISSITGGSPSASGHAIRRPEAGTC